MVDIISDSKNFRIEKIPCRTIFEIQSYNEKYTPLKMWRLGVQFEALTFAQCSGLVNFINCLDYLAPVSAIESNPSLKGKRDMIKLGSAQSEQMQMFLNVCKKRRRHSRKPCEIAIYPATRIHAFEDVIKNISLGGVYIETRMPFAVGQSISMKFRLPKVRKLIHVTGEIVWAGLQGIGVEFRSTAATNKAPYFKDLKTNKGIKKMGKIKKKRVRWQPSASSDVTGYRLYWSNQGEVDYNSTYAELSNVSGVILPDDISSFPLETGNIELGISAINQAGNESDITKLAAYFSFTVPDAPLGLEVEDV
ncbi:MAG: PilZ domain-containing protein [Desulfobacterales bacterium]|nr:PilZ domain-containing protein [Desulfobacterales bacterium]